MVSNPVEVNADNSITPGHYLFRPNPFVPWINVQVFTESLVRQQNLRVRLAGVEIDAAKLINRGQWKTI